MSLTVSSISNVKREQRRAACQRWRERHPERVKDYTKRRNAERKTLVDSYKDRPCTDCGKTFPRCCMDFDHVHGEKTFLIGQMRNFVSEKALLTEIAKCDVVCACCHRVRTYKRRFGVVV